MTRNRDPLALNDATARLGRELYAEVRRLDAAERAETRRWQVKSTRERDGAAGSSWSDGDASHADGDGGCDGGSD